MLCMSNSSLAQEILVMWSKLPFVLKLFKKKTFLKDFFHIICLVLINLKGWHFLCFVGYSNSVFLSKLKSALIECVRMLSLHNSLNWKIKCFTSLLDIHSKLFNFRRKKNNHMFSCIVNFRLFHIHCIKTAISILMYRFCKYYAICNT